MHTYLRNKQNKTHLLFIVCSSVRESAVMSRGRDMMKWQNALMSHLDETDSDSDKESALSGSFMVDSVM